MRWRIRNKEIRRDPVILNILSSVQGDSRCSAKSAVAPPFSCWWAPCLATMAAVAKAQRRSGSMRPGGLGSTQLIQKLAQLAWYWWPPYSSLKLSVSELNAYESERVKYYYTPDPSVHSGDRRIDIEEKLLILLPLSTHNHNCLSTYQLFFNVNRHRFADMQYLKKGLNFSYLHPLIECCHY